MALALKTYEHLPGFAVAGRPVLAHSLDFQLVGGLQSRLQPRGGGKSFSNTNLPVYPLEPPSQIQCFLKRWDISYPEMHAR